MTVAVSLIAVDKVDAIWPYFAEMVINGIAKRQGDIMPADLWTGARAGDVFMLAAHTDDTPKGVSFWRFVKGSQGPVLNNILTAGEDMADWLPEMDQQARSLAWNGGARLYRWEGPKAWGRIFPKAEITTCTFSMKVDDE